MDDKLDLKSQIIGYALGDGTLSDREIARRCNCSQPYVSKILNNLPGLNRNTRIDWDSFEDDIEMYFQNGYTKKQIAMELEIPYTSLVVWMNNRGLRRESTIKPIQGKREHGKEYFDSYTGRTFYDFTDFFIDRPCICGIPQWKIDIENGVRKELSEDEFY